LRVKPCQRIAEVRGILYAIAYAIKTNDFKLERVAAVIYGKQMKILLKVICTPVTNDKDIQTSFENDKMDLRDGIILIFKYYL
jgi:hypothetical protein